MRGEGDGRGLIAVLLGRWCPRKTVQHFTVEFRKKLQFIYVVILW